MVVGFAAAAILLLSPIPSIPKPPLPPIHSLNSKTLPSVFFTTIPIRNPRNPRRRRSFVVLADNNNNGGPNKESKQQRANSNGNNGGGQEDLKKDQRAFFNFKWRNLLDPDPENIVAIGLTGLLTWASVQVLYQLFFISIAILVAALKMERDASSKRDARLKHLEIHYGGCFYNSVLPLYGLEHYVGGFRLSMFFDGDGELSSIECIKQRVWRDEIIRIQEIFGSLPLWLETSLEAERKLDRLERRRQALVSEHARLVNSMSYLESVSLLIR